MCYLSWTWSEEGGFYYLLLHAFVLGARSCVVMCHASQGRMRLQGACRMCIAWGNGQPPDEGCRILTITSMQLTPAPPIHLPAAACHTSSIANLALSLVGSRRIEG